MTDTRELVDELRLIGCHANGDARCTCVIGQEAADALEAQAEENRRLREALEEAIHDADQTLMLLGDTGWRKRHRAALTSGRRGDKKSQT